MARTSRTKLALAKSIKELMQTVPLERISVSDIVGRAGIGRNTFYYHFQDKYDLVNWIFRCEVVTVVREKLTLQNWSKNLKSIEEYFLANKTFYRNALTYTGQNSLQDYIYDFIRSIVRQQAAELPQEEKEGVTEEDIDVAGKLVACTFLGMLVRWAREEMNRDTRSFNECVQRLLSGAMMRSWVRGRGTE